MGVKLVDLRPRWIGTGGEGVSQDGLPVPRRERVGIILACPCGKCGEENDLFVPFDVGLDGQPYDPKGWHRTGDTFETLTLMPSIQRMDGCRWHGFITNGEIVHCG